MNRPFSSLLLIGLMFSTASGRAEPTPTAGVEPVIAQVESDENDFSGVVFPEYPELRGMELVSDLRTAQLLRAIRTALNSDGDELQLQIGGELFVPIPPLPILAVGGEVDVMLTLSRHVLDDGSTVFELSSDSEVLKGARVTGGILGVEGLHTTKTTLALRFSSPEDLVRAIQGIAIRIALGEKAQSALGTISSQLGKVNDALAQVQAIRNYFVGWLSRYLPGWVIQRLNELNAERNKLLDAINRLNGAVKIATSHDQFFRNCPKFVKLSLGGEQSHSIGATLFAAGGDAAGMLGAELAATLETEATVMAELRNGKLESGTIEVHLTGGLEGGIGLGPTVAGSISRGVVISGTGRFTDGGFEIDSTRDSIEITTDRSYTTMAWAAVGAGYAAGRTVTMLVDISTLVEIGVEGVEVLMGDDPLLAAGLVAELPVVYEGQARVERDLHAGFVFEPGEKSLGGGLWATGFWIDQGEVVEFEGAPSVLDLVGAFRPEEITEQAEVTKNLLTALAEEVGQLPNAF